MSIFRITSREIKFLALILAFVLLLNCEGSGSFELCREIEYEDNDFSMEQESNDDEEDRNYDDFSIRETTTSLTTPLGSKKLQVMCSEDAIMYYLAELQVINPETILQIASYKDLERSCRMMDRVLKSIDALVLTCTPLPQSHLYMQLITGVKLLHAKLCVQSDYQLAFKGYASCFQELHNEYIDCGGPADWTENMDDSELCMEYKAIADCYYTQTALLCGIKAAKIMKELVVRVINAVIETHCPEVRKNPIVEDAMPEHAVYPRESKTCKVYPCAELYVLLLLILSNIVC